MWQFIHIQILCIILVTFWQRIVTFLIDKKSSFGSFFSLAICQSLSELFVCQELSLVYNSINTFVIINCFIQASNIDIFSLHSLKPYFPFSVTLSSYILNSQCRQLILMSTTFLLTFQTENNFFMNLSFQSLEQKWSLEEGQAFCKDKNQKRTQAQLLTTQINPTCNILKCFDYHIATLTYQKFLSKLIIQAMIIEARECSI